MKITAFSDAFPAQIATGGTWIGSASGSNSGYTGGDVVGDPGNLSVVGLRSVVSLASNLATGRSVGDVMTLVQVSPSAVAQFATPSNSGGASAGSNSTRVSELSLAGVAATFSPSDHQHDGIGTVTASSSNTLQRGTLNLRAGSNVTFGLTDSDGDGELDTLTVNGSAGGGSGSLTVADEGSPLSTAATTLDFVGAGVVASGTGATKTITIAGGGGASPSYLGYNTAGGSTQAMAGNRVYATKITAGGSGNILLAAQFYLDQTSDALESFNVGLFEDSAGVIGKLIGQVAHYQANTTYLGGPAGTYNPRWWSTPLAYALAASTSYWVGIMATTTNGGPRLYYDGSGSDRTYDSGGGWLADGARYTQTDSTRKYSIRALVI